MIGKTILHYQITEKLGAGGMGVVYKARDTKLDRDVAIKFLPRQVAANTQERHRFEIEAKAAGALNHPNIATIYAIEEHKPASGDAGEEMFIVMEYIEGKELRHMVGTTGPVAPVVAIDIATQIAAGLQAAHAKGIVHRDIKSANIMITEDGRVKIMDFGLAKIKGGPHMTRAGSALGTPYYMSPEQARGEEVDARSDIWSFGVVLYEMLTGELPFKGDYEQAVIYSILNEQPVPVRQLRPDTPLALTQIVDRALAKSPEQRYSSIENLQKDLQALAAPASQPAGTPSFFSLIRNPRFLIPIIGVIMILTMGAFWWVQKNAKIRWARKEVLPKIEAQVKKMQGTERKTAWLAFEMSEQIESLIPDDPLLKRLEPEYLRKIFFQTQPAGARVYAKAYADSGQSWRYFGQTPLDSIPFPLGFSRIKLELEGYATAYDLVWNLSFINDTIQYALAPVNEVPENMVFVPRVASWFNISAAPAGLHLPGLEQRESVPVGDFWMDRYEVTNAEYKRFVDAGGYRNPAYWKLPFRMGGRELSRPEALKLFVDKTGQPGPATWEVGDYPDGQDNYPVSGVSWYEAAAYAEFAGKNLPTIYHWDRVAFTWASSTVVPASNLSGKGPVPVGSSNSMNRFGVFDIAGNVREWCVNESSRGGRMILGGGWDDPAYAFNDAYAQDPFDRSPTNGFRCIRYLRGEADHALLEQTIQVPFRDFFAEKPVSDAAYKLFLRQYNYDNAPLNAEVESVQEEPDYIRQKITFNAAYGGERMMAYLFLPRTGKTPFQTVVYFPGSGAIHTRSSENLKPGSYRDFILKSGRALMYPIYKSTFERGDALHSDYPSMTNFWKDHVIMWAKDFRRSLDYLETRKDIDSRRLAYYGVSWGGAMGGIVPAVEPRLKTTVLVVAGLLFEPSFPEVEPVNFLPRIKMPVLMLNGKYDFFFPYETSQKPFFDLLGTPATEKRMVVHEGGHSFPRTELVKEILTWLDRYLGPVQK